jgi:hypothetical protein
MMRRSNFQSILGLGIGALALALVHGPEIRAQFAWHGPTMTIATGVSGNPSLIQAVPGTYGTMGNYELVTPSVGIGRDGAFLSRQR